MLSGCSSREEKVELIETNQLEQSKTDDKTEEKVSESNEEETLDLSGNFNGITGCAVLYSPSENKYSLYNKPGLRRQIPGVYIFAYLLYALCRYSDLGILRQSVHISFDHCVSFRRYYLYMGPYAAQAR